MISFRLGGEREIEGLANAIQRAPEILRNELRIGLIRAARPAAEAAKRALLTVPMDGKRTWTPKPRDGSGRKRRGSLRRPDIPQAGGPLRAPIARAVQIDQATRGANPRVSILIRTRQISPRSRWLVRYITGTSAHKLRHPFMGLKSYWVAHPRVHDVWTPVLRQHLPRFTASVRHAVDDAAARIER